MPETPFINTFKTEIMELPDPLSATAGSLNNLKIKVDDLVVGNFKIVPIDLKKLSDVVSKEVVKKKFPTN